MMPELVISRAAPCTTACPAGVNVQGYVGLISQGRFREALDVVRAALPFPGVCGRVCPAPCEKACERIPHGGGVAVRALKRFIADVGRDSGPIQWPTRPISFPERIAVVGSGPAGLTAALDLRQRGYAVTIFEGRDELGGMLTACLPSFRLPGEVVREEIEAIASLPGIDVKTGMRIGRDLVLPELLKQGYSAVLVAIGAHQPERLGVPNDDADGVVDAIEFLSSKDGARVRGRVLVIGGGSTAMDAARTALRMGCEEVRVIYRRTRLEMPAGEEEVGHALEEGVIFQTQAAPVRVLASDRRVIGLLCERTRPGEPDASGRRRPVVVPDSAFEVPADCIIAAIGQRPDAVAFAQMPAFTDRNGRVKVVANTLQTQNEWIFAAGDAVTGPATIVEAVGQARHAAAAIHRALRTGFARAGDAVGANGIWQLASATRDFRPRTRLAVLDAEDRRSSFEEVEFALNGDKAMAEAARCLKCGPCTACQICSSSCLWRAAALESDPAVPLVRVERALLAETAGASLQLEGVARGADAQALVSLACSVEPAVCRGCGKCVEVCSFDAVRLLASQGAGGGQIARIDPVFCRGCGICVAECPSGAIDAGVMSDAALRQRLSAIAPGASVAIRCQWSAPSQENDCVEIRVPCAGRVSAGLVAWALARGAKGVTVTTCEESACKYGQGAKLVSERLKWLVAAEGDRVLMAEGGSACPA